MSGLAGLPDISDEDFLAYQADTFRRQVRPIMEADSFRASIQPTLSMADMAINEIASAPLIEPEPVRPQPSMPVPSQWDELGRPVTPGPPPGMDGMGGGSLFGEQPAPPSSLLSELSQLPPTRAELPVQGPPPPPAPPPGGDFWNGDRSKPNVFSYIGQEAQRGADALRASGATQTPLIGGLAGGAAQGAADIFNRLGGSAEALRQGNVLGGIGGAVGTALSPGDPFRSIAKEVGVPNQVLPQISPETPVLGGLNNPQEWAGLLPELAMPATALENVIGRGVGAVAKPAMRAIGEVASPFVDRALSGMGRAVEAPLGAVQGGGGRYYHGTSTPFDRASVPAGGGRSYALPGYYATPDPDVAGRYAGYGFADDTGELIAEEGAQIRSFDLDPDTNLFETRRVIPEEELRQIVREMNRVEPGLIDDEDYFLRRAMSRQGPEWGPERAAGIGALFTLRTAGNDEALVQALKNLGYHGVRADEAGEIISLFDTGITKAKNALSGQYGGIAQGGGVGSLASRAMTSPFFSPARTGTEAATDITLGTAGGTAAALTADEDATWEERAGRFALGAAAGSGLGAGVRGTARTLDLPSLGATLNPPPGMSDEQWRGMSRNERRRANWEQRRGEYANRPRRTPSPSEAATRALAPETPDPADIPEVAADNAYDEVYERQRDNGYGEQEADETAYVASRSRQVEAEEEVAEGASRLYDDNPEYVPDESPTPKQTADEAVRELTEGVKPVMPFNPVTRERQSAFMEMQQGLEQPGVSGALRKVAEQTGSSPAGSRMQDTMGQLNMWEMDELLDPDMALQNLPSRIERQIERGKQIGAEDTPEVRDYVQRVTRAFQDDLLAAHGRASDEAVRQAALQLEPYALDIARTAEPGLGTSAPLVVLMNRAVEATDTPAKMAYDRWRYAVKTGRPAEEIAALAENAKMLQEINAVYRLGQEVYSSEAGRSLRANRADVYGSRPFIPRVSGAAVDAGDEARRAVMGETPPRLKARQRFEEIWAERLRLKRAGEVEPVSGEGYSWNDLYWAQARNAQLAGRSGKGSSGRVQGGALEREGLLWQDLFIRDDSAFEGTGAKLSENERMRWLFGFEEVGIGPDQMDAFWDRLADINPDDRNAVLQFWGDAEKLGGRTTTEVLVGRTVGPRGGVRKKVERVRQEQSPWEQGLTEADKSRALPEKIAEDWQGYLDAAETMPREKALKTAQSAIKNRKANAEKALKEAQRQKNTADIRRYEQDIKTAEKDLNGRDGLYARFERAYPPDIKGRASALAGERSAYESAARATTGEESEALTLAAQQAGEQIGPAWRREQYRPGFQQGFYDDPVALVQKAQLLQQLDEVNRYARWARGGLSVATSNMLTSARMVQASTLESAVMMANRVLTQWWDRADPEGAKQIATGMWQGAIPAYANLTQALKTGMGPMEAMDFLQDVAKNQAPAIRSDALRGKAGYLAPMHRVSRGIQEFFTTIAYYGELNRLAHMEAAGRASGPTTAALTRTTRATTDSGVPLARGVTTKTVAKNTYLPQAQIDPTTLFANPTEAMRQEALQKAAEVASGGPHSFVAKMIVDLKANLEKGETTGARVGGAVLNVFFPFVYGIDYTVRSGLNLLVDPIARPVHAAAALRRGDTAAAKANAYHFAHALAVDMFLFSQIAGGNITGKGPSDPATRQALLEATDENGDPVWRPDSMRVPLPNGQHFWINYTSLPVVGLTGAIMANMWDAWVWDGKKDMTPPERFATLAANTAGAIAEGTFFRDTLDLASILTQPQSASTALSRLGGGLLSRALPGGSLLRQVAYASDPSRKTPENIAHEVMQAIPGARGLVPNQVSPYTGSDVDTQFSWSTLAAPGTVYYGQDGQNPLASETARLSRQGLDVAPSDSATQQGRGASIFEQRQPGSVVRGVQGELAEETGPRALAFLNSPQYQAMSDADKAASLQAVFGEARRDAEFAMKGTPDIRLSPGQQMEQVQSGVARFRGVRGTPEEIDRRNRQVSQARTALSEFSQLYGPTRGERMLRRISPEAWRLIRRHPPLDPDRVWRRERSAARGAGFDTALTSQPALPGQETGQTPLGLQFVAPDYVPNLLPPPETSLANRRPPSSRGR